MGDKSGIQWTEATWNPSVGCSKVSPACKFCYAEKDHKRLMTMGSAKYDRPFSEVRMFPDHLGTPLRWSKPRMIFVNSMSDLFHEDLSNEEIAAVFGVMAGASQHTFQVLTKREDRLREWFGLNWDHATECGEQASRALGEGGWSSLSFGAGGPWPLSNVWLGVSVEDQEHADKRIPKLLQCPAAVRWVSYEPALGPIKWDDYLSLNRKCFNKGGYTDALDWAVIGGESGPNARPFELSWVRDTIRQFAATKTPLFVKQLGARPHGPEDRITHRGNKLPGMPQGFNRFLNHRKGGDPDEWPEDLRVREWPRVATQ